MSQLFDQIANETPQHVRHFVDMSFDVADRIQALLTARGMQQKDLARALKKQESEVSKWLSGTHNFTLKTISKISDVLRGDIIQVPNQLSWESHVEVSKNHVSFDLEKTDNLQFQLPSEADYGEIVNTSEEVEKAKVIPFFLAA